MNNQGAAASATAPGYPLLSDEQLAALLRNNSFDPIPTQPTYTHGVDMASYANDLLSSYSGGQTIAPQRTSRDSLTGPSRPAQQHTLHRRDFSTSGGGGQGGSAGGGRVQPGPYARPAESHHRDGGNLGPTNQVKASSTTSEFTKRKNWSQHIIDEIQDFMHILSPTGNIMFATPSIRELTGWTSEEVTGRPIADFIHTDDVEGFLRDYQTSLLEGNDLTLYYRFRMKDDRYTIFEITGHPYYAEENGQQRCKCFFAMGRPYPSKNTAMLDSFLELKIENERLRQDLQVMYSDLEASGGLGDYRGASGSASANDYGQDRRTSSSANPYGAPQPSTNSPRFDLSFQQQQQQQQRPSISSTLAGSVIDPTTGLVQPHALLPSTSNTYGALGIGISATSKGDGGPGDKKKKKLRVEEGEFVCRDCGTVESPEWRKGPEGPKSLCNACGLRYAKLKSKGDKLAKAEKK